MNKDTERLNWLSENRISVYAKNCCCSEWWTVSRKKRADLRQAIDLAMKSEAKVKND